MPTALLDTLVSLVLPGALFVGSLWRIADQARSVRGRDFGGLLWLGCSVIVNVIACFWCATMLNALRMSGQVPPALASYSYSAGTYLFAVLAFVLAAPSLLPLPGKLLRRAWRRGPRK